jgi:cyclohexa-1,5-dienecarbonyl-CoA hydratase
MSDPIRCELSNSGDLLTITLARPKANILDRAMVGAIREAVQGHGRFDGLKTILFTSDGPSFSYGASVEEHRPGEVERMLPEFHALFRDLAGSRRLCLAAVRGQCLGGGLELAMFCHRLFAAPEANLGNPEIALGVLAPVASVLLPFRLRQPDVDSLLLTGQSVDAPRALAMGLVDELAEDPAAAALEWHARHLAPRSASSLRFAVAAARARVDAALETSLATAERFYLGELMKTHDAREGIAAFLEKRPAQWKHR